MYTPPPFKSDRAKAIAFAQARGFGTICAWDGMKPVASVLPFCLGFADDGTPIAKFHVARGNALARLADGKSRWLLAVSGATASEVSTPNAFPSLDSTALPESPGMPGVAV